METRNPAVAILGIDASYNSTGLCVRYFPEGRDKEKYMLYRLVPSSDTSRGSVNVVKLTYDKINTETKVYENDDLGKVANSKAITYTILHLIKRIEQENPHILFWDIRIEGNVMGSFGGGRMLRINDMVTLTSTIKLLLKVKKSIVSVYAPMELKKLFCGRGAPKKIKDPKTGKKVNAEESKEMMVNQFLRIHRSFDTTGKIDDVVDAYGLAVVPLKNAEEKQAIIDKYLQEKQQPEPMSA